MRERRILVAQKQPQGVPVRGHAGLVLNKLSTSVPRRAACLDQIRNISFSVMILEVRSRTGFQNRKAQTKFGVSDEKPLVSSLVVPQAKKTDWVSSRNWNSLATLLETYLSENDLCRTTESLKTSFFTDGAMDVVTIC